MRARLLNDCPQSFLSNPGAPGLLYTPRPRICRIRSNVMKEATKIGGQGIDSSQQDLTLSLATSQLVSIPDASTLKDQKLPN